MASCSSGLSSLTPLLASSRAGHMRSSSTMDRHWAESEVLKEPLFVQVQEDPKLRRISEATVLKDNYVFLESFTNMQTKTQTEEKSIKEEKEEAVCEPDPLAGDGGWNVKCESETLRGMGEFKKEEYDPFESVPTFPLKEENDQSNPIPLHTIKEERDEVDDCYSESSKYFITEETELIYDPVKVVKEESSDTSKDWFLSCENNHACTGIQDGEGKESLAVRRLLKEDECSRSSGTLSCNEHQFAAVMKTDGTRFPMTVETSSEKELKEENDAKNAKKKRDAPSGGFFCETCGKRFTKSAYLEKHVRVHTGQKPFACGVCNKTFSQKGNLVVHHRVHTNEKPFSCTSCGKSFRQKSHLESHLWMHLGPSPI